MRSEAYLFAGVAAFFLVTDAAYIWFAREPVGIAALTVSFLMSALIAFFCAVNYRRKGERPEDRPDSEVRERGGVIDFFPPHSGYPPVVALGVTVLAIGVVFGLWLAVIGFGIMAGAVVGMVFQFSGRDG
ncbi:cytochrome c oxidase subunit 4 [Streptomyces sp. TRM49041]|uniref:aa3-type cytochrome oxidase subunit IV n=1 Tax=Streptomyces sp. TRM49041 TaxID=2603216 RepID=UPI0011EE38D5|nr:cytochrome c oxidase subunit 4 [Streptomyces sp. TRM49041]